METLISENGCASFQPIILKILFNKNQEGIKMKKLAILAVSLIVSLSLSAAGNPAPDYIQTEEGTFFYKSVKHGFLNYLIAKTTSGLRITFEKDDIKSYQTGGRTFERVPRIENGKLSELYDFSELVYYRQGVKIFKQANMNDSGAVSYSYHMFRENTYLGDIKPENADAVFETVFIQ